MKGPLFYSKILLFGEYGIIKDSKGLSIPYNFYKGALKVDEHPGEVAVKSNESLGRFAVYLKELQQNQPDLVQFDIEALQEDVAKGMYFDSTIPQGYGVGSSGALVASIYDKYAFDEVWSDHTHLATNKNTEFYSEDVADFIVKELEK